MNAHSYKALEDRDAEIARLRAALAFYADPFDKGEQVPDFYSELDFGERAREALSPKL